MTAGQPPVKLAACGPAPDEVTSRFEQVDVDHADVVLVWRDPCEIPDLASLSEHRTVLVVGPPEEACLLRAVEFGARGYLDDRASHDEVAAAVETLASGGSVVSPLLLGSLLRLVVAEQRNRIPDGLSPREREVFLLAVRGLSRREIADALYVSEGTIRTHLARIYRKLGVHSRAELIAIGGGGFNGGRL